MPSESVTVRCRGSTISVANAPGGQSILPAIAVAGLELSWMTEPGWSYQVETSPTLSGFSGFGPVMAGDGSESTVMDVISSPVMFYRVARTPAP